MFDARDPAEPFETLFRENFAPLCEFVHGYVRSQDAAQDIVQDLFLTLWQKHGAVASPELTRAYLFTAARNRAFKHLRHQRVVQQFAQHNTPTDVAAGGTDHGVRARETADAVNAAIAALPDRCREIFLLSRRQHLSNAEIATALGLSIKTVEVQMWQALRRLRECLAPHLLLAVLSLR